MQHPITRTLIRPATLPDVNNAFVVEYQGYGAQTIALLMVFAVLDAAHIRVTLTRLISGSDTGEVLIDETLPCNTLLPHSVKIEPGTRRNTFWYGDHFIDCEARLPGLALSLNSHGADKMAGYAYLSYHELFDTPTFTTEES